MLQWRAFLTEQKSSSLHKEVTLRYATALYMSSVLGSGILILPGLAAQKAGPASLIAWVGLSLVSYPLATLLQVSRQEGQNRAASIPSPAKRSVKGWRPRSAGYSFYGMRPVLRPSPW